MAAALRPALLGILVFLFVDCLAVATRQAPASSKAVFLHSAAEESFAGNASAVLAALSAGGKQLEEAGFHDPRIWGPPAWFFLHSVTLALPEEVPPSMQAGLRSVLVGMTEVLPCPSCGRRLSQHLWDRPVDLHATTREGAVQWMIDLHSTVNRGLGKRDMPKEEVLAAYEAAYSTGEHRRGYKELLGSDSVGPRFLKTSAVLGFLVVAAGTGAIWLQLKKNSDALVRTFRWRQCPSAA